MQIVQPSFEVYFHYPVKVREESGHGAFIKPQPYLEVVGRTCYKSEDHITEGSASEFIKMIRGKEHGAMLEHCYAAVKFICDRGVSHELVRHRLASYAQESTRYCNYSKGKFGGQISVIHPPDECMTTDQVTAQTVKERREELYKIIETQYMWELDHGLKPEIARGVLPTALKTEIWMSADLTEWLHVFKLRTSPRAHPQMKSLMCQVQKVFAEKIPEIFGKA